jgi:hypothetical protein
MEALFGQRDILSTPDPVENTRMGLPSQPDRYGASLTNRSPDVVDGVRPDFQMPGQPLVNPDQNRRDRVLTDALAGMAGGTRYVRRSQLSDTPFNPGSPGMAMFAETANPRATLDDLRGYGPSAWISRGDGAADVRSLQPAIVRALREARMHEEMGTTAAALARDANPQNIINSAGLWDNPALVREVWDSVLEPRGITSVKTSDGLLIFDPRHARPIRTAE